MCEHEKGFNLHNNYPSFEECVRFHGHACPGLATGYRVATAAMSILGVKRPNDEELVCVAETDACGVDAIQFLLGCTLGKGNLIYRDHGKQVYTLICRQKGRSVRVAVTDPVLNGPYSEAVTSLRPAFDWVEVDGASGYTLQIARNATFTSLLGTYTRSAAQTDYTPLVNLPAYTVLYWRVRANSPTHGPGNWSNAWFTTPNPPSTPALLTPANGATLTDDSPRFDWTTSTLPAGTEFALYRLQLCFDAACSTVEEEYTVHSLTSSEYEMGSVPGLDAGSYYYWRVRAENRAGAYSAWSARSTASITEFL